jgi:hypothetical protein
LQTPPTVYFANAFSGFVENHIMQRCSLWIGFALLWLFALTSPLCAVAAPLKVLVIGGPPPQNDMVLAEMLSRAYGWETRYTSLFATAEDLPLFWQKSSKPDELRRYWQQETVHLLRDWQPAVTLACLPREESQAMASEIQRELVRRVKNGMGLVTWSAPHGGSSFKNQPLADILPGEGFGPDYSGGTLYSGWKWAAHRLNFGIPMDQAVQHFYFDIRGKATDYQATDLVLTGKEDSGRMRVRQAGRGRVVMWALSPSHGLSAAARMPNPSEPYTMEVMRDRPDWAEIHLRLIRRVALWAKGEKPAERIALNIQPLTQTMVRGTRQQIAVQVLNETGQAVTADVWSKIGETQAVRVASLTAPAGQSEQKVQITLPNDVRGGWVPLELSLRTGNRVLGSPPATALRYLRVKWPVEVVLNADRRGALRGETIHFAAKFKAADTAGRAGLRVVWTVNDYQRRVLGARVENLAFTANDEASNRFEWKLPELDSTHFQYTVRATVMRNQEVLGDATETVFRSDPFDLNEGIYYGVWTNLRDFPEAIVPSMLDLYEDTGYRALHTFLNEYQIHYQEERNWRGYAEAFGNVQMPEWATLSEGQALKKGREDVAQWLRRNPLQESAAIPVISLSEEAGLEAGYKSFANVLEEPHWLGIPAEMRAMIRQGYLQFLQRRYGTIEKLNAQWEKSYTSWDQVEELWQYYNWAYTKVYRPAKGVLNVSQFLDQRAYLHDVWQKAYDAHTAALKEALPFVRTTISTGDFFGTRTDLTDHFRTPEASHNFYLGWDFSDSIPEMHRLFGERLLRGTTMAAFWFDYPLQFNADLTRTRAALFHRGELKHLLERESVVLHAERVEAMPEVAIPRLPIGDTIIDAIANNTDNFTVSASTEIWRQMLHVWGAFPESVLKPQTRLALLPLAVAVDESQAAQLGEFVRNGGTLFTTAGLAQYNSGGKPYQEYPGAGLSALLGLKLQPGYYKQGAFGWSLSAWPQGAIPVSGTLFSTGRDTITHKADDVKVLGTYRDGTPALLYRRVGRGHVFHFNGVYCLPYLQPPRDAAFWPRMSRLLKGVLDLADVRPAINVVAEDGQPLDELDWNIAGAGTDTPSSKDVRYLRLAGSLLPEKVRITSTQPIAFARDALWGRVFPVEKINGTWNVTVTRGPESAHYITLLPYKPDKLVLVPEKSTVSAGSVLSVQVRILDSNGEPATGRHAVTLRATLSGIPVTQWKEIQGEGTIPLPLSHRDAGEATIQAIDWTGGLRASTKIKITPSPFVTSLPQPLPAPQRGMKPRQLSDAEVVERLNRLAGIYTAGPKAYGVDETKWRLGYHTFMIEDGRHNVMARELSQTAWSATALLAALNNGARWILTGEDLGIDGLQSQRLSPYDRFAELAPVLKAARSARAVAGTPDQVIYTFANGGRLLLDRRSFDYWTPHKGLRHLYWWRWIAAESLTGVADARGGSQQFSDAYNEWWNGLNYRGLVTGNVKANVLLPLPARFELAKWWKSGFDQTARERIVAAASKLDLPPQRWLPSAQIGGYRVGKVLLDDTFDQKSDRWTFEGGIWKWEDGRLMQTPSAREVREASVSGRSAGGFAVAKDVADPNKTPILIEARGCMVEQPGYGRFGVAGGWIPNRYNSGLQGLVGNGKDVVAGHEDQWLPQIYPANTLLHSLLEDIQYVLLIDGKSLRFKVWNPETQSEPKEWQLSGTLDNAQMGTAIMLNTRASGYWDHVRVWQLEKL